MRKGARRRDWTVAEERFLVANAGKMAKREICRRLKRSSKGVECKARALRRAGVPIDLRCHRSRLAPCPACGCPSGTLGKEGICEPCRRREQLDAVNARAAELWPHLAQANRDTYERTEAQTSASRRDPRPKAPDTRGMSRYSKARAEEAHALALEAWTVGNLKREIKRAQKRKERIEKKSEINEGLQGDPS